MRPDITDPPSMAGDNKVGIIAAVVIVVVLLVVVSGFAVLFYLKKKRYVAGMESVAPGLALGAPSKVFHRFSRAIAIC